MQKVILLQGCQNISDACLPKGLLLSTIFCPSGENKRFPATGVLWHEGLSGRNDEDVSSAYAKILQLPQYKNFTTWVFCVDNCAGQNKCWTLFTLVQLLNEDNNIEKVTLKCFIAGHTFMMADHFHRRVEKEIKCAEVLDFKDFKKCVIRARDAIEMKIHDFKQYTNGLSQDQQSKSTRPSYVTWWL